jgi:hypothetical protein
VNADLHTLLTKRADSIDPPVFDPKAVEVRGELLARRRNRLAAAATALVLVLVLGTSALLLGLDDRTAPSPAPEPAQPVPSVGSRPVTYGQGQVLHLGDREFDTHLDFLTLDLTDEGAALTTLDGSIWFTDGTTVERIGGTLGGKASANAVTWTSGRPRDWVVSGTDGSLLAWVEYPGRNLDSPELVVYDAASRSVVSREPLEVPAQTSVSVLTIVERRVFLESSSSSLAPLTLLRYDVDSGALQRVGAAAVEDARRSEPRALVVGPSAGQGNLLSWEGSRGAPTTVGALEVQDSHVDGVFDPTTGEPISLEVDAGRDGARLWFTQWLDDERFVLVSSSEPYGAPTGDLLVCSIGAGRCDLELAASDWTHQPLLPGDGGVGAELALGAAMRASNDDTR